MNFPLWCVHCHRVWEGSELTGEWPYLICPDTACNAGQPSTFMPYTQTRRLLARHWPIEPQKGLELHLHPPAASSDPVLPTRAAPA